MTTAALGLTLAGRMAIAGSFSALYVWAAELYPTPFRNSALSIFSTLGKIGAIVAPLTEEMVGAYFSSNRCEH